AAAGALAALALWFAPEATAASERLLDKTNNGAAYVAGELIVIYKEDPPEGAPPDVTENLPEQAQAEVAEDLPLVDAQVIEFPGIKDEPSETEREASLQRTKEKIAADPAVEAVDYNYVRQFSYIPNDPRFGDQYGLRQIEAPRAWDRTRGKATVRIGVVDSGIRASHPDLNGKLIAQYDFGNGDGVAEDTEGHGTHVSGVAAAETGNRAGVAGACPNCRLMMAKVDRGGTIDAAAVIEGINWAANRGAKVINLSLGATGYVEAEARAVSYAQSRGAVVVAAAGNANSTIREYPAAYRGVLAVAATTRAGTRANFSNRGDWIDIAAPGVDILSTAPSGYSSMSGTSFSSPYVAGVAGLLASQGRSPSAISRRITGTATDLGPDGRDPYYGAGRLDAAAAVGIR
ncbi:MAG TPA: S8 family serine peptidase, partial [Rubrobacteraceae bacterium]|nr:S8 family serine peptidase [Rubrobacteraceae bacterium]